jgi:hypothetical protein
VVQHPAGLPEPLSDLADDVQPRGPHRGRRQRGAVPARAEVFQQVECGRGGQLTALSHRDARGAQQPGHVDRPERVRGRVVGEDPGQEQRDVAEPPVDARPGFLRHHLDQPGQLHRVQLAEPPRPRPPATTGATAGTTGRPGVGVIGVIGAEGAARPPAPPRRHPVPPAGHPGEGRQQFREEQPTRRGAEEIAQLRGVEHGDPLPRPRALRQVIHGRQVGDRPVHRHAEGEERGHQDERLRRRGAEHGLEHPRIGQQPLDGEGITGQAAHRGLWQADRPREQPQVRAGEVIGVFRNLHRSSNTRRHQPPSGEE